MSAENILLIRLSSIGDVLHCTPVAKTLREAYPQMRITWLVGEKSREILEGNPYLDKIIVWRREQWEEGLRRGEYRNSYTNFRFLEQQLKAEQCDIAIDLQGLLLTGLIGWRSGARTRIGFAGAREASPLFYTHKVHASGRTQIVTHYLQLLRPLGIKKFSTRMVMPIGEEHYKFAVNVFSGYDIKGEDLVIVLNPSTSWATKCWPAAHFSRLANLLQAKLAAKILLLGARGDAPLLERIISGINGPALNLAGKTNLKELAAVVQNAHLFIGGDTGPLHIAAAVGTPTISLFGPTDPRIYAPLGAEHRAIVSAVACKNCHKRKCPDFICMEKILPEEVYRAAEKIICKAERQKRCTEATAYGSVSVKTIHSPV